MDSPSSVGRCAGLLRDVGTGERAFEVPGYDVGELLGAGSSAGVWRGVERATGEAVALKGCHLGADPSALHREAAALAAVTSPYVVRLRAVVGDVLVLDLAEGGSLSDVLLRRGVLTPAEVVTVAAPLAQALAAVHGAGLVHGDVAPGNVLFTADGMPLLCDLAGAAPPGRPGLLRATAEYVDPVVAGGGEPGPASDVWALGALCHHLLTGTPPFAGESVDEVLSGAVAGRRAPLGLLAPGATRALVAVVESALALDPERRPSAAALATALLRAQAAAPVQLRGPRTSTAVPPLPETEAVPLPPGVEAGRHRDAGADRRPRWRSVSPVAVAAGVLVAAALAGGLTWALSGPVPAPHALPAPAASPAVAPTSGPAVTPAAPDWRAVLSGLDRTREQAFAQGDAALLERVYLPGSPALTADRAAVAALVAAGRTADGVRHDLRGVRAEQVGADRVDLVVTDVLGPATVRGEGGAVLQHVAGRAPSTYRVTLARQGDTWLIARLGTA